MFYEKRIFKELKRKSSRDCMISLGKCSGHTDIGEKEPLSILIADKGIFLERAKGPMEHVLSYKQMDNTIVIKTADPAAKKLTLFIHSQVNRNKGCKVLDKYMSVQQQENKPE